MDPSENLQLVGKVRPRQLENKFSSKKIAEAKLGTARKSCRQAVAGVGQIAEPPNRNYPPRPPCWSRLVLDQRVTFIPLEILRAWRARRSRR